MTSRKLRLLSLDGGGVRGLSSLYVLQQLMQNIGSDSPPKPCEYFDMICGTSTGGLIAIMLGRLKMDVMTCIRAYSELSETVFRKVAHRINLRGKVQARFDSAALEDAIKTIICSQGYHENTLLRDDSSSSCRVFVCATRCETRSITHLTSYYSDRNANDENLTIWQAARATSAASSFFDPITLGEHGEEYLDGATGANNPIRELWSAAKDIWPQGHLEDRIQCLVSIGTGQLSVGAFGSSVLEVGETLLAIATDTEHTAEMFLREHRDLNRTEKYFRFNVDQGLQQVGLEEASKKAVIIAATRKYLESQHVYEHLLACRENMKYHEVERQMSSPNIFSNTGAEAQSEQLAKDNDIADKMSIHDAARMGSVDTLRLLKRSGANLEKREGEFGLTPLHTAVQSGKSKAVRWLINNGARIDEQMWNTKASALHIAASLEDDTIARALIDAHPDLEIRDSNGRTPLFEAVSRGRLTTARMLLEHGANLSAKDQNQETPLHAAAKEGKDACVRWLIKNGCDKEALDDNLRTPLHLAALYGKDDVVMVLLEQGANPLLEDSKSFMPAHSAAYEGHISTILLFLNAGTNINVAKAGGVTMLHWAARKGCLETIEMLIGKGADINALATSYPTWEMRGTPLHVAVGQRDLPTIQLLISRGADVQAQLKGEPLLHTAVWYPDSAKVVHILLRAGADVNARDKEGRTALMTAAYRDHEEAAQVLLDGGANPRMEDTSNYNQTAYEIAVLTDHKRVAALLRPLTPWQKQLSAGISNFFG